MRRFSALSRECLEVLGAAFSGFLLLQVRVAKRLVRLEIPRIGDSEEDAYGCTLAYVYLDNNGDGEYEHLYNEDLIRLGLSRTTTFSHGHRREFERLREEAEERGASLWGFCPEVDAKRFFSQLFPGVADGSL